jgi:hypothetical protein|tara:strand:+ start:2342 stop:2716 length:375 start_codon:yes stop_codon:yes gene_type:complete
MSFITNNNVYTHHPGIFEDGRLFTDYASDSGKNENIKKQYGIKNNRQYREFLTKHANMIMERNRLEMTLENNTGFFKQPPLNGSPYKYKSSKDTNKLEPNPLKMNYLTREQLQSLQMRPYKHSI